MFNTFNMGVGMVLTVAAEDADQAIAILQRRTARTRYILGDQSSRARRAWNCV